MENEPEIKLTPKRIKLYSIVTLLLVGTFALGFVAGQGKVKVNDGKIEIDKGEVPSNEADYSLLWDALDTLNSKYVDRPLDQQKLLFGAVSGLVAAAGDPYTVFFTPQEAEQFQEQLRGSFDGIGAEIGKKDEQIVIVAPLEGTPAERAGVLAGDLVLQINGESTTGMTTDVAVSKIRGKAGTEVVLTVIHPGQEASQDIKIIRNKIEIKSVKLESKEANGKKYAVIKMNQFGDDTEALLSRAIDQVNTGGYAGLILDLRNNPGGYLETAVSSISNWVDPGQVAVKEIGYKNTEKVYKTEGVPRLKGMKTIVLVNGGSASASEIVAGALQDYKSATLVGIKTFGKGSVQELEGLRQDSEIKITVAKWYTPNGRGIDKTGLEPDVKVEMTPEDVEAKRDPQMDRALELLQ